MSTSICIVGASGYTGAELIRVLSVYQEVEIVQIVSRQFAGRALKEVFPVFTKTKYQNMIFEEDFNLDSDYYFLALPHDASLEAVNYLIENGKKVIDLSGAYRIKDISKYPEYYGFEHRYTDILKKAVYGLPEIFREDIKKTDLVANPGCYPTSVLLGLYPSISEKIISEGEVIVNSLSGISGAGRGLKQQFHYPEAYSDVYSYSITKHRHTPEMEDVLFRISGNRIKVRFTPHIIPISRGMLSTITFKTDIKKDQLKEIYYERYRQEPFVRLLENPPHIKNVVGSNYCDIYVDKDEKTGYAVICTAIDNLGKGASTQAIQNLNIMLSMNEEKYINDISQISTLFP